jgi:4-hydroxy-tetrahydrodipicolinate synthase
MMKLDNTVLRGSYPPLITPFRRGAVDFDTFERLVERQVIEGSHGILVSGTSAEPSTLTLQERVQLFHTTVRQVKGRVPIVAATGSQSLEETVELTQAAENAGVDAVLIVTPYYVRPPQRGIVAYYEHVSAVTRLPVLIYHIPPRTAVTLTSETICEIAVRAPNVVGMKHTSTDLTLASDVIKALGTEFRLFAGLEDLSFPMLGIGATGIMNALGNLVPRPLAAMCEAMQRGDWIQARQLHFHLLELNQTILIDTNPIAVKYMMRRMGLLDSNEHRLPMVPATAQQEKVLDGVLERAALV